MLFPRANAKWCPSEKLYHKVLQAQMPNIIQSDRPQAQEHNGTDYAVPANTWKNEN